MNEEPQNKDPEIIGASFQTVIGIFQLYGWIILFVIIAVLYLQSKVRPWLGQMLDQRDISSYKKMDAGSAQARLEAMERARLKMQAEHDENARKFAENQKKREEEKRSQRLSDWDSQQQGKSYRSKARAPEVLPTATAVKSKPKKTLKPEYNPLMGDSSSGSTCFRPSRRGGPSSGGG